MMSFGLIGTTRSSPVLGFQPAYNGTQKLWHATAKLTDNKDYL